MKKLTCYAALILAISGSALAQEGPSYADTANFIINKVAVSGSSSRYSLRFPNQCVMEMQEENFWSNGSRSALNVRSVELRDLDPSRTEVSTSGSVTVAFFTRADVKKVTYLQRNFTKSGEFDPMFSSSGQHNVIFVRVLSAQDNENGNRVARAMRHLIEICGGKEELF